MFKIRLLAVAAASALAASAMAADVQVYGLVDYGFQYENVDQGSEKFESHSFSMKSGMNSGSRFGLKGGEDLGNGVKVGFVLESGFTADDGALDNGGRLFGREANLFVTSDYGTLSFGRVGTLMSANGTYGLMNRFSVFSGGWGSHIGGKNFHVSDWGRLDNTVTYASPELAGLKFYAQYSFQPDTKESHGGNVKAQEGKSTADRQISIALTYGIGNLELIGIAQTNKWSNLPRGTGTAIDWREKKDGYNFLVGATYDFGVAKVYATGEYDHHMRIKASDNTTLKGLGGSFSDFNMATGYVDGHAVTLGTDVPAFGGTFKADLGYRYAECVVNGKNDYTETSLAVGYVYDLSKRTSVYAGGAYTAAELGKIHSRADTDDLKAYEVVAGMVHRF